MDIFDVQVFNTLCMHPITDVLLSFVIKFRGREIVEIQMFKFDMNIMIFNKKKQKNTNNQN